MTDPYRQDLRNRHEHRENGHASQHATEHRAGGRRTRRRGRRIRTHGRLRGEAFRVGAERAGTPSSDRIPRADPTAEEREGTLGSIRTAARRRLQRLAGQRAREGRTRATHTRWGRGESRRVRWKGREANERGKCSRGGRQNR